MVEKSRKRANSIDVNQKQCGVVETARHVFGSDTSTGPRFGCRHVQALLLCLGLLCGIGTRTNFSVAIVAMTDDTASPNPDVPTYNWTNTSVILSAFFWSYATLQVLAGYLGKTYGPKYFFLVTFCINYSACAAIPLAASKIGSYGVILCRIIQGLSQGFLYPSVNVMLGTWAPYQERATLNNIVFAGVSLGSMYASVVTGYVSASWWGWPYSFYILAVIGYLWCILWAFFGQNSPATHPRITAEEKKYIQSSLKQEDDIHLPTPWKKIFTCVPFYAIMVASVCSIWGHTTLMIETPTYLAKIMNFDVKSNALIATLPTAIGLVSSLITGPLSDWLVRNNYMSILNARRIFHLIGAYGQSACLVWLSYLTASQAYMSIVVLSLNSLLGSFILVGSNVNHMDLSPRFCGVIFGIINATGQGASIVAPLAAQWLITDPTSVAQWRMVFLTAAGFSIVGSTQFFFFSSATRQPWDGPQDENVGKRSQRISLNSLPVVL